MDDIIKITISLENNSNIVSVNEVYTRFFKCDLPSGTIVGVSAIAMDALVQIDTIVSNCEGNPPQA